MNMRRITSLTALLSFLITLWTSVVLYIMPHGRTAYWSDWRFWGLSKDEWGALHINLGILFLLALLLHIWYNWKPITNYLKNKAKALTVFTPDFNIALVVCLVCMIGTLLLIPPFSTILDFGESIKEAASRKYGEPPWGHAELSPLNSFAKKMDWDPAKAMAVLKDKGFNVESGRLTLRQIADANKVSPQDLYNAMLAVLDTGPEGGGLPDAPPAGFGMRTLQEIATEYDVPLDAMLRALKEKDIQAEPGQSVKTIAGKYDMNPYDVFEILKAGVKK